MAKFDLSGGKIKHFWPQKSQKSLQNPAGTDKH